MSILLSMSQSTGSSNLSWISMMSIYIIIIMLIIRFFLSKEFQKIANDKGYQSSSKKYRWLVFFFGVIGMLLVVALPDLKLRNSIMHIIANKSCE